MDTGKSICRSLIFLTLPLVFDEKKGTTSLFGVPIVRFPRIAAAIILSSFAVSPLTLAAQSVGITTGDLKGRVSLIGTSEIPPGVVLRLENTATGETRTVTANERGEYGFRILPAGTYLLTVEGTGLSTRRMRDIDVWIGTVSVLDIELSRETEGSEDVSAEGPATDAQRTQISTVIDPLLIESLPINRRSFVDFSLTVPGVARSNMPQTGAVPSSGLSFRGMTPRQNRFLVDGLDNNDLGTGAVACPVSQGAVKEFQVITGALPAEFGRATGGVVNSLLRSGTNATMGSLFAFYRPGQWDATSGDGSSHDDFRQQQFGATVGGAIIPDRLFYFASAERYRKRDVQEVSIDPVLAMPLIATAGFQVENGAHAVEETQTSALVKFDYLPDDRNRWALRLSTGDGENENQIPWGGIVTRTAGGTSEGQNSQLALSHQWLGGENWMNEARALYARQDSELRSMDPYRSVSVEITGVAQFGTNRLTPQDTASEYYQFTDTATLLLGSHTVKAGVDLLHSRNRGTVEQNAGGMYVFQAIPGLFADSLTAFAAGVPVAYVQSWGDPSTRFSADSGALFLQDDWQVTPRFLLKFGLRYDREGLPSFEGSHYADLQNPPAGVVPGYGPIRLPDGAIAYSKLFATDNDWSDDRLSPRASFSWQAKDPLRVYGGFGVYSGSTQLGSLFGPRLYNEHDVQTRMATLMDPVAALVPFAWAQPGHTFSAPPPGSLPLLVIPGSYRMPKTRSWSLGFEWKPAPAHRLTLDFLYSRGSGFMNVRDVNAYVAYDNGGTIVYRRPDLRYSQILRVDGTGENRYWGQTVAWQWRASEGLALGLSYTHSKAEDNYTDWTPDYPLQNTFDPGQEWGLSSEDQTHQWQLSAVYRTRSTHPLLRSWTIAAIAQYASGRPYSKLVGYDRNMNGDGASDRPVGVDRNSERGPDIRSVDLRVARSETFGKVRMDFIVEVFNLFNTTNVLKVQNVLSAPEPHPYGSALEYGPKRQLQFGVKASF